MNIFKNQRGDISKTLIVLIVVILLMVVAVYFVIKFSSNRVAETQNSDTEKPQEVVPIYENQIGDVKFTFMGAKDFGTRLKAPADATYVQDLVTTERFIQVKIGAQNKGKATVPKYSWQIGNILDEEGRSFAPIDDRAFAWLPKPDQCGAELKPEFTPVPCTKIYEVSKASKQLGVEVATYDARGKQQKTYVDIKF